MWKRILVYVTDANVRSALFNDWGGILLLCNECNNTHFLFLFCKHGCNTVFRKEEVLWGQIATTFSTCAGNTTQTVQVEGGIRRI